MYGVHERELFLSSDELCTAHVDHDVTYPVEGDLSHSLPYPFEEVIHAEKEIANDTLQLAGNETVYVARNFLP
jgi:hypothetical protein